MQIKQYNVKIFEITIEEIDAFRAFLDKNAQLLTRHLLYLKGRVTPEAEALVQAKGLAYTTTLPIEPSRGGSGREAPPRLARRSGLVIVDELVRSGRELVEERDLLLLKRVNSGATVRTDGNFIGLSPVEGTVVCDGDFMLIKPTAKARIVFNGAEIAESMTEETFYKVRLEGNEIIISPYAKDIPWA